MSHQLDRFQVEELVLHFMYRIHELDEIKRGHKLHGRNAKYVHGEFLDDTIELNEKLCEKFMAMLRRLGGTIPKLQV